MEQDFILIWRMKSGDERAFDAFVGKYYPSILQYCRYHCADRQQAEDLTQEVFLKFFRSLAGYRHREKAINYLYTIARNLCIDFAKEKQRQAELEAKEMFLADKSGETHAEKLYEKIDVEHALERLDDELRETVLLYYFQELKVREIARLLKIGVPLVKYRLKRARELLRELLE